MVVEGVERGGWVRIGTVSLTVVTTRCCRTFRARGSLGGTCCFGAFTTWEIFWGSEKFGKGRAGTHPHPKVAAVPLSFTQESIIAMSAPCVSGRISASAAFRLCRNASPTSPRGVRHINTSSGNWAAPIAVPNSPTWKSYRTSSFQPSKPSPSFTQLPALARSRRRFSTTPIARHGHLDPPKPGEEYLSRLPYA
jgi:hypothetical protein